MVLPHPSRSVLLLALSATPFLAACSPGEPAPSAGSQGAFLAAPRENFFRGEQREEAQRELARLREIQSRRSAEVRALPGVSGMGIGLDRATAKLEFVVSIAPGAAAVPQIDPIEGVAVEILIMPEPELIHGGAGCQPCHDDLLPLPVEMGNSAHTEAVSVPGGCLAGICSLGFKACDLWSEDTVYVTNAHCATSTTSSCAGSAGFGAPAFHRSPGDAASCTPEGFVGGVESERPPLCGVQNTVDATSVESDASLTQTSIRDIGVPSAYPGNALPGDHVQKSGRTTGHTFGIVGAVAVSFSVTSPSYCGCSMDFADQILILPNPAGTDWVSGGDSGSAVLDFGDPPAVVGLNFARIGSGAFVGGGYANTVNNVLFELDLSLNPFDCIEPCAATLASRSAAAPRHTLRAIADFRDYVLVRSPRGRGYIDTFYRFTGSLVSMMVARPALLARTTALLAQVLPIIEDVTEGRKASVERKRVRAVASLFSDYAEAADDPALRAALLGIRADLSNDEVLREFGVTVTGR